MTPLAGEPAPPAIRWMTAFIDRPMPTFTRAATFWAAVTNATLSPRRGDHRQFVTLVPAVGDACLRVQGVQSGPGGAHLDFEVDDPTAMAEHAVRCGATLETTYDDGVVLLSSPAGLAFCVMGWSGATAPPMVSEHDNGAHSSLDQVCLDIPPSGHRVEVTFWSQLTGWPVLPSTRPEFELLQANRDQGLPLTILLQRLDRETAAAAHLDMACSDVDAVMTVHRSHGAVEVGPGAHWIVMRDPAGGHYCLTDRKPT